MGGVKKACVRVRLGAGPHLVEIKPQSSCSGSMKCCMDGKCETGCNVETQGSSDERVSLVFKDVDNTTAPDLKLLLAQNENFDQRTDHNVTVKCATSEKVLVGPFTVRYYRYRIKFWSPVFLGNPKKLLKVPRSFGP